MDYNPLPLLLILVSLGIIIVIIVRKFPQLSLLDVDSLPEVKEEKKKDEFLKKRAAKRSAGSGNIWATRLAPLVQRWKKFQLSFRKYVGKIERAVIKEESKKREQASPEEKKGLQDEVRTLLQDGAHALEKNELDSAEKKYIAAIRVDSKCVEAYRGLGDVYLAQEQFEEAKETYGFVLTLEPSNDTVMMKLAELEERQGNIEAAIEFCQQAVMVNPNLSNRFAYVASLLMDIEQYQTALEAVVQALDLEPQNPKYLDMLVEISILVGDKEQAVDAYERLRMVNPENQKLAALKERVANMS